MKNNIITSIILTWLISGLFYAQHISEFNSLTQGVQDTDFHLPSTHYFQYIIEHGDALTQGGILPDVCDFAGYVPINSSSKFGYLSINSESAPGAVTILDIELNESIGCIESPTVPTSVLEFGGGIALVSNPQVSHLVVGSNTRQG